MSVRPAMLSILSGSSSSSIRAHRPGRSSSIRLRAHGPGLGPDRLQQARADGAGEMRGRLAPAVSPVAPSLACRRAWGLPTPVDAWPGLACRLTCPIRICSSLVQLKIVQQLFHIADCAAACSHCRFCSSLVSISSLNEYGPNLSKGMLSKKLNGLPA